MARCGLCLCEHVIALRPCASVHMLKLDLYESHIKPGRVVCFDVLYRLQENSRSVSHHQGESTIAMSRSPKIPKAPKEGALFREHEKPPNRGIKSPRLWASVNTLRLLSLPPGPVRLHGLRGLLTACHPGLLGRVIYGE